MISRAEKDGVAWHAFSSAYPVIAEYIQQFELPAKKRSDKGDFWWKLRPCDYYQSFEMQKIVSTKVSIRPTFMLDNKGYYLGNTCYLFTPDENPLYLLGVLNSDVFLEYAKEVFAGKQNDWYEVQPKGLEEFPIPISTATDRDTITDLVQRCLDKGGVGCEQDEAEINERVTALYGLKDEAQQ